MKMKLKAKYSASIIAASGGDDDGGDGGYVVVFVVVIFDESRAVTVAYVRYVCLCACASSYFSMPSQYTLGRTATQNDALLYCCCVYAVQLIQLSSLSLSHVPSLCQSTLKYPINLYCVRVRFCCKIESP